MEEAGKRGEPAKHGLEKTSMQKSEQTGTPDECPLNMPNRKLFLILEMPVCICVCAKLLQSSETLCDPTDCSPPGSSVHGILQARILGWVAMPFSRGSFQPRSRTCVFYVSSIGKRVLYH